MREETAKVLDEHDLEMVALLSRLGVNRNQAKVIVYLAQVDEALSNELEQGAEMRQPEVSVAVRALRNRGWVAKRDVPTEGKGRPRHSYRLRVPLARILDRIEEDKRRQAQRTFDAVDRLRSMARDLAA